MRIVLLMTLLLAAIIPSFAQPRVLTLQRAEFLQAQSALQHHDYAKYFLLSNLLRTYPLYPYLRYAELTQSMTQISQSSVNDFLQIYADTPLAVRLRAMWLDNLAKQQRWSLFLKYYEPLNDRYLQCNYLYALIQQRQIAIAFKQIGSIWLSDQTQPAICQKVFDDWQKSGGLTSALIWQRFTLAMTNNNLALAKTLIPLLPTAQQIQANLWIKLYNDPFLVEQKDLFAQQISMTRQILIAGITRLAQKNPEETAKMWPRLLAMYHFNFAEQQTLQRTLAISLAHNADPNAHTWLDNITPAYADEHVKQWRIRIALMNLDWRQADKDIQQLSLSDQQLPCWCYWHARAQAALGNTQIANPIFVSLAKQVDYYGLLASQQLNQSYRPIERHDKINAEILEQINAMPAIQRAHELYALQFMGDARREWQWATRTMNASQLLAAANLAEQWGWMDRVIITTIKAGENNDTRLRFPLAYKTEVLNAAQRYHLEPAWIFAIIHQESGFMSDSKSDAGALGLMQLMPQTANILEKDNDLMIISVQLKNHLNILTLLNPTNNILLGSKYLKQLLGIYDNNFIIATAAYDVGPTRLQKFLPLAKKLPTDIWVEILPWKETREYVQHVSLARAIYERQISTQSIS